MSKWIAEFELEDGDTMPEHMDLNYNGAKIDFHCRPMWIPCSERLPKLYKEVLVTCADEVGIAWYIEFDYWHSSDFDNEWLEEHLPIAWMPLPEPYKEESEGAK